MNSPHPTRRPWTTHDDAVLTADAPIAAIAQTLGRTETAVRNARHRRRAAQATA